ASRRSAACSDELGGGLRPPSEPPPRTQCEPQDVAGLGSPPSEASNPEIRAAGRRGAGVPAVRGEQSGDPSRPRAGPRASEASIQELAPAKPALESADAGARASLRQTPETGARPRWLLAAAAQEAEEEEEEVDEVQVEREGA